MLESLQSSGISPELNAKLNKTHNGLPSFLRSAEENPLGSRDDLFLVCLIAFETRAGVNSIFSRLTSHDTRLLNDGQSPSSWIKKTKKKLKNTHLKE